MFLSTQSTAASNAHLTQQNAKLLAEVGRLKAEIERLQDLQSPEHARLERIATALFAGLLQGYWANPADINVHPKQLRAEALDQSRALIADLDSGT